jgi:hypothetical protein
MARDEMLSLTAGVAVSLEEIASELKAIRFLLGGLSNMAAEAVNLLAAAMGEKSK